MATNKFAARKGGVPVPSARGNKNERSATAEASSGRPGLPSGALPRGKGGQLASGQYVAGKEQGGAKVLASKGVPGVSGRGSAADPKPPQGGGKGNLGRQVGARDKAPGADSNAGEVRHPETHAAFESLGKPKGGRY